MKGIVLYCSNSDNVQKTANLIAEGMNSIDGIESLSLNIKALDHELINKSTCIILDLPYYYADYPETINSLMNLFSGCDLTGKIGGSFTPSLSLMKSINSVNDRVLTHMIFSGMVTCFGGSIYNNQLNKIIETQKKNSCDILEFTAFQYGKFMGEKTLDKFLYSRSY